MIKQSWNDITVKRDIINDTLSGTLSKKSLNAIINDTYTSGAADIWADTWVASPYTVGASGAITSASTSVPWGTISADSGKVTLGSIGGNVEVLGDTNITGNLKVDGVDLGASLKKIEERLNILRPNADIEARWEELKALGDQYRALEEEILGREALAILLSK